MSLWSRPRTVDAAGETTPLARAELQLQQRREGLKQAQQRQVTLGAQNEALKAQQAQLLARRDITPAHERAVLDAELAEIRAQRDPIRRELEEVESSLKTREELIYADEREVQQLRFRERYAERNSWVQQVDAVRETRDELVKRLCQEVNLEGHLTAMISVADLQLAQEARELGVSFGPLWERAEVVSDVRKQIVDAWNAGLSAGQAQASLEPERSPRREMPALRPVPRQDGVEIFVDETGENVWEAGPIEPGRAATCDVCHAPAVRRLTHTNPERSQERFRCEKHAEEWTEGHIRQAQQNVARQVAIR